MRDNVRSFVQAAAETFALTGPVFEFGSYLVEGQNGRGDLRELFPGMDYVGCDQRQGPGVDRIEDLADVNLPDESAGTIVCVDTLEHVFEVSRAVKEMIRLLKPGGVLLLAAPMDFRIHDYPDDYWRLTPSCVARLLSPLAATLVGSQGLESYPHTVLGIGCKAPAAESFPKNADRFQQTFNDRQANVAASARGTKRLKHLLRFFFASKGERRRRREFYRTQFSLHFQTRSGTTMPETVALGSVR